MTKRSRIILMTLHIVCAILFAANAVINFNSGDALTSVLAVIASVCWTGCTAIDIIDMHKNKNTEKDKNDADM